MGEPGNNVYAFGNWGAPSPSPRTFFSALLGDDISSRAMLENNNMLFPGRTLSSINHEKEDSSGGLTGFEITRLDMYSRQKTDSHGGLVERMAARAGFNAPKLNTESCQNQDSRSSLLTIPPGLSPTTLLESPVFLSNALAQPSPTNGKFPFSLGGTNNRNFSQAPENPDKSLEDFYADVNASSFEFKPVPESGNSTFNNFPGFEVSRATVVSTENSSPPEGSQQDEEMHQPSGADPLPGGTPAEDGYNWRKYGQKQVKGSEYPQSYFKCTHPNCSVKKKVERSLEGHITEIIYKGAHSHSKPVPNRRSGADLADQSAMSLASVGAENFQVQNGYRNESGDVVDGPSAVSNDGNEAEDDRATHGSASLGYDGEEDESVSKRRKIEAYAAEMSGATRAIREPRIVVQTISEVDILDDGYRWRKYGQKVVKGNPNPRSYYKCTHTGCTVRKHVERASHDLKSVITTYEGKHNHEVPAARNSSHLSSANASNGPSILSHLQRPEPAQSQFGPDHGFNFGMNQPNLANLAMAELGPVMPGDHYIGQQQIFDEMGFMLPKREPKAEPFTDGSSIYHQMMSRMPLGP